MQKIKDKRGLKKLIQENKIIAKHDGDKKWSQLRFMTEKDKGKTGWAGGRLLDNTIIMAEELWDTWKVINSKLFHDPGRGMGNGPVWLEIRRKK